MSIRPTSDRGYLLGETVYDDSNKSYRMGLLKTDSAGNFIWNVTSPGTDNSCGYYAQQTDDGGFIMAGTISVNNTTEAGLVKLNRGSMLQKHKPVQVVPAPPMVPGFTTTGGITGRVTTYNTSFGIANVDVWVVNASNTSQYYLAYYDQRTGILPADRRQQHLGWPGLSVSL